MKLVIVLLLVPGISSFLVNTYQGFDHCGINGWICNADSHEVILDCSESLSLDARIWIWTARLPTKTSELTVMNCNTLEVHVDCTVKERDSEIRRVQFINITTLHILKPTPRYQTLHDNHPVPKMPPYLRFENVSWTSFYEGLFDDTHNQAQVSCSPALGKMEVMIMKNVMVEEIPENTFFTKVQSMVWVNVTVKNIMGKSMNINASAILIQDSTLPDLTTNTFHIRGNEVEFLNNNIKQIQPSAIRVFSDTFNFKRNKVDSILTRGLFVLSTHININRNKVNHMGKGALEAISPSFYSNEAIVSKITYSFIGNEIDELSPFSLHNNWTAYKDSCSEIKLYGNRFDCTCYNLAWFTKAGDKSDISGFYDLILKTTHHCGTSANCSLLSVAQHMCKKDTPVEAACTGLTEKKNLEDVNDAIAENNTENYAILKSAEKEFNQDTARPIEDSDSEKMILYNTYFQDQSKSLSDATGARWPAWTIVLVILVLGLINGSAVFIWLLRRKKNSNEVNVFRYEKNKDSDSLIIGEKADVSSNECENPTYNDWSLERVETVPT